MNAGDVVRLKSGGAPMTVAGVKDGHVDCVYWLDGSGHRYLKIGVDCVDLVHTDSVKGPCGKVQSAIHLTLLNALAFGSSEPRGEDAELGIVSGMYDASCEHPRNALAYALARHERYVQRSANERPKWYARSDECATALDPITVVPTIRPGYAYGVLSDGGVIRVRLPCL